MRPTDIIDRAELLLAADWWRKTLLAEFVNDAGDFMVSAMATWAGNRLDKPTERQANDFRDALVALMAVRFADGWKDDEPRWGSGCRTLAVDYGPDHLLSCALGFCGLRGGTLRLPIKTTMWVSPNSVRVREGYSGQERELMPENNVG